MARTKGTYSLPANIEVLAGAPLDARDRVATKADLTTSGTFPYPYVGMETFVVSEGKKYVLTADDPTQEANWSEVGSGGGAVEGYYNTTDGLFYKENTYTTAIPGAASTLYIDLATNKIYRYNGSTFILTPALGLTIAADSGTSALDLLAGTKYKITVGPDTFIFKTPNDTKNTAGSTNNTTNMLYLVGATSQAANSQTYSNENVYVYKYDLYSEGSLYVGRSFPPSSGETYNGRYVHFQRDGYGKTSLYVDTLDSGGTEIRGDFVIEIPSKSGKVVLGQSVNNPATGAIAKWDSDNSITAGPTLASTISSQTQSTRFLREDGTWSAPSYTTNTNTTYSMTRDGESIKLTPSSGTAQSISLSSLINGLGEGTSPLTANDYIITQYVGGGTSNTTYYRRAASNVINATLVKAALGTGSGTSKYLREDGTWQTPSDTKVRQSATTTSNWRKILLHYTDQSASDAAVQDVTNIAYGAVGASVRPSDGTLRIAGNLWAGGNVSIGSNASNTSGAKMTFDSTTNSVNFVFA